LGGENLKEKANQGGKKLLQASPEMRTGTADRTFREYLLERTDLQTKNLDYKLKDVTRKLVGPWGHEPNEKKKGLGKQW